MADYKKLYFMLFNKLTDLSEEIATIQQQAEELYLELPQNDNDAPDR